MQDLALPTADLLYSGFALPFCPPDAFPALWEGLLGVAPARRAARRATCSATGTSGPPTVRR